MRALRFIPNLVAVFLFANNLQAASDTEHLPIRGEWARTSVAPLSDREGASIAWSGSEIFVFGGTEILCPTNSMSLCLAPSSPPLAKGAAAYNPLTDEWRLIAAPPVGVIGGQTVTIGSDIFTLALSNYSAESIHLLRYQSKFDNWDEFDLPQETDSGRITAFGTNLVFYHSSDETGSTGYLSTPKASVTTSPTIRKCVFIKR